MLKASAPGAQLNSWILNFSLQEVPELLPLCIYQLFIYTIGKTKAMWKLMCCMFGLQWAVQRLVRASRSLMTLTMKLHNDKK